MGLVSAWIHRNIFYAVCDFALHRSGHHQQNKRSLNQMATALQISRDRKIRISISMEQITEAVKESMFDFIVTFTTMLVALIAVVAASDGIALLASVGMFVIISVYLILLVIRILRRLDDSWTLDELAMHIVEMKEQLDRMERNA